MRERRLTDRPIRRIALFESFLYADEKVLEVLARAKELTPAKRRLEDNYVSFDAQLYRVLPPATRKTLFGWIRPFTVGEGVFTGSLIVTDEAFNNRTYGNVTKTERYPNGVPCYVSSEMLVLGHRVAEDYFRVETCVETRLPSAEPGPEHELFARAVASADNATLGVGIMQLLVKQLRATEPL